MPLALTPLDVRSRDVVAKPASGGDLQITVDLVNSRRLTIPAALDPDVLARLLPILDAS